MVFSSYNFADPSTNYTLVEETVKEMFSYIMHRGSFERNSHMVDLTMEKVTPLIIMLDYDRDNNSVRYLSDVQTAYELLKQIV